MEYGDAMEKDELIRGRRRLGWADPAFSPRRDLLRPPRRNPQPHCRSYPTKNIDVALSNKGLASKSFIAKENLAVRLRTS